MMDINEGLEELADEFDAADFRGRIDIAARVRDLLKRVEILDREMSEALKASHGLDLGRFVAGACFEVKLGLHERFLIDQKALRESDPVTAERYGRTIQYEALTFRAR